MSEGQGSGMWEATVTESVLRRKIEAKARPAVPQVTGAERGLRLALARAGRDAFALALDVPRLDCLRRSLTELLEMPEDLSFHAVLEGPGEGLGLIALAPPLLAGLVEVQTVGRVRPQPAATRKPSRTDAAMVQDFIDRALAELDLLLLEDEDRVWASGFRYASFLDDPRPLGLLLEDCSYRVLVAEVELALGAKSGQLLLAVPADGRGERPHDGSQDEAPPPLTDFGAALAEQVMAVDCRLEAVLGRITLPLVQVLDWQPGDTVPLPQATLDHILFVGLDGHPVAEGRLGQHRGMRAVRLAPMAAADPPPALPEFEPEDEDLSFAMTGTDE